jgi:hypothetical protein
VLVCLYWYDVQKYVQLLFEIFKNCFLLLLMFFFINSWSLKLCQNILLIFSIQEAIAKTIFFFVSKFRKGSKGLLFNQSCSQGEISYHDCRTIICIWNLKTAKFNTFMLEYLFEIRSDVKNDVVLLLTGHISDFLLPYLGLSKFIELLESFNSLSYF